MKILVFWCKWVKLLKGLKVGKFGFTIMDLNEFGYKYYPFILVDQVSQVFYVKDPKPDSKGNLKGNPKGKNHLQGKRRIVGIKNAVEKEEYNKFEEVPPFLDLEKLKKIEEVLKLSIYTLIIDEGLLVRY